MKSECASNPNCRGFSMKNSTGWCFKSDVSNLASGTTDLYVLNGGIFYLLHVTTKTIDRRKKWTNNIFHKLFKNLISSFLVSLRDQ